MDLRKLDVPGQLIGAGLGMIGAVLGVIIPSIPWLIAPSLGIGIGCLLLTLSKPQSVLAQLLVFTAGFIAPFGWPWLLVAGTAHPPFLVAIECLALIMSIYALRTKLSNNLGQKQIQWRNPGAHSSEEQGPSAYSAQPGNGHGISSRLLQRNPNFVGRGSLLHEIERILTDSPDLPLILWGGAGVGKTQVAREFAYVSAANHKDVLWLDGADPLQLRVSWEQELRNRVDSAEFRPQSQDVLETGRRWLQSRSGWVVVIDNLEPETNLAHILPSVLTGRLLITSRNPYWGGLTNTLEVPILSEQDGASLLDIRTKLNDPDGAKQLSSELGHLPLALEHAGAYIEQTGLDYQQYLTLLRNHPIGLLETGPLQQYSGSLVKTVSMLYQKVDSNSPISDYLLLWLAVHSPDNFTLANIESFTQIVSATFNRVWILRNWFDPIHIYNALSTFHKYGLVHRSGNRITMHRMVQKILLDIIPVYTRKLILGMAIQSITNEIDLSWRRLDQPALKDLSPHVLVLLDHAKRDRVHIEAVARALCYVALYFRVAGRFDECERAVSEAETLITSLPRASAITKCVVLLDSAMISALQGRYIRASEQYEQYTQTASMVYGRSDYRTIAGLADLGWTLLSIKKLERARIHFYDLLERAEYSSDVRKCVWGYGSAGLAMVMMHEQQLDRAAAHAVKAVHLAEEYHGATPCANFATCLAALACVRAAQGNVDEATAVISKSANMARSIYGSKHPEVAKILYLFTDTLLRTQQFTLAREYFAEATASDIDLRGFVDPLVVGCIVNHHSVLCQGIDSSQFAQYLRAGSTILELNPALNHPTST